MSSMSEFLDMGGYAFYVWTSYGITAAVLVANVVMPMRQRRVLLGELRRRIRRESRDDAKA